MRQGGLGYLVELFGWVDWHLICISIGVGWVAPLVGMKTDGNERKNPSTIFTSIFYYGKRELELNN